MFTSDCGWWVVPLVERDGIEIRVSLQLEGHDVCLPVVREKELPFQIGPFPAGEYTLLLSWAQPDGPPFYEGPLRVEPEDCTRFLRGDVNADQEVDLVDVIATIWMLLGGSTVPCQAAADLDGSGTHDLTDPVLLLEHLFKAGPPPAPPYPDCGPAPGDAPSLPCKKTACPTPGDPPIDIKGQEPAPGTLRK